MQKFRKSENSEKPNEPFLRKTSNGHTGKWTDQQTDKGEAIKTPCWSLTIINQASLLGN